VEVDPVFLEAGEAGESLILQLEDGVDDNNTAVRTAHQDIVIATDGSESGILSLTPEQDEGLYFPVGDLTDYDNDLTSVEDTLNAVEFTLLNLNTATSEDFLTIPDMSSRMVREFEEYRPYVSILQFRREIGKYVDEQQVASYEAYVFVPVNPNESDAETLKQLPGVDEDTAAALIAGRPYASNEAFLEALAGYASTADVSIAVNYLAGE
jgi:DNA uptake protein ComE-like DNA-binding protein